MKRNTNRMAVAVAIVLFATLSLISSLSAQDFYQGKQIKIIVGNTAGGFYDRWGRLLARHLPKHIPGNPEIIVQNMAGAGSIIATNYVSGVSKPDGLTLLMPNSAIYLDQLVGRTEVQFDMRKFAWIGSPVSEPMLIYMRRDAPYQTIADIRKAKEPPRCGSTGTSSSDFVLARLLEEVFPPLKIQTVLGYPGGSEIDLAVEKGEVQCRGMTASPFFGREPFLTWQKTNFVRVILFTGAKRDPRIPDVATIHELFDKENAPEASRRVAQVILAAEGMGRPVLATPGTPADRVKILREAFAKSIKDPELLAEAKKSRMDVDPSSGEELEALIRKVLDQPPEVVARVKKFLTVK
ncbi:MAG: hypothetical protein A3F90_15880 [Deltaproteobacteria bacterium RIFCSPLOWO2_12_FULL_60_19]|nr:MAG: hypothetical protein A3F90_15880 [Deltaproteobacteria bacterium RIFCSPLOWO2_12_FULL_60_19]